jgi:hypothetical protein
LSRTSADDIHEKKAPAAHGQELALTMLTRLSQAGEQVDLYVKIVRLFRTLYLVPALGRRPPPSLAML